MELKTIYPIITTLIVVLYFISPFVLKAPSIQNPNKVDILVEKGMDICVLVIYLISWLVWFFMFIIF
jgi:hypothetical protein